jgi:hypothetical protein
MADQHRIPEDPVSPLLSVAIGQYELFAAYQQAGFSREEALQLVMNGMSEMWRASLTERRKNDHEEGGPNDR